MKKITRRQFLAATSVATAVSALAFAGCGSSSTSEATSTSEGATSEGGEATTSGTAITIGQVSEVANLNPVLQPRTPDSNAHNLIYSHLVAPTEDLNYVGDLAESFEISEDGLKYTFKIRQDAIWHDGTPVTANDVVFTFTSLADPTYIGGGEGRVMSVIGAPEYQAGEADTVAGIYAEDDYTAVFELAQPNAAFLGNMYCAVLPQHILGEVSPGDWETTDFNTNPIGSGKYKFVRWESGQFIEFVKNEEYYGEKPSIEKVFLRFGDDTTLTSALINGEIDVFDSMSPNEIETVEAMPNVSYYSYQQLSMYYIGLNQLNAHLSDLKVRQALSHGLNKEQIIATVYGDTAKVTNCLFPTNHWSASDTVTVYEFDQAKAKALLEEAGYAMGSDGVYAKDGEALMLRYDMSDGTDAASVAQLIQQQWSEIGVKMEIITQDFATLAFTKLFPSDDAGAPRAVTAEDFDMYTLGFGVEADPDEYRDYFVTPEGVGSWNFITYSNSEVDSLFEESRLETDPAAREAIYHEISDIFSVDIPWIPLYEKNTITGLNDRIQNFVADYRGVTFQIQKWTLV